MKNKLLSGKTVGVLGLARSGIAAANLARRLGASVLISDVKRKADCTGALRLLDKGVEVEFDGHSARLLASDLVIKSPGIHGTAGILADIRKNKIPVWSEIELALRCTPHGKTIAITGTNGKTTTTTLAGEIFKAGGRPTVVGGNIGAPLAAAAESIGRATTIVLEMSSYQLEDSTVFRPDVSAILNITPDHLEHHHTMKNYAAAKERVFAQQGKRDFCVLNYDDPLCRRLAKRCPAKVIFFSRRKRLKEGVYYAEGRIYVRIGKTGAQISAALKIPGMHNIENALAAVAVGICGGVKPLVIEKVITSFTGVEHRIELSGERKGVKYYNDSKATNVDSTRVALESFGDPVWLILGGRDKGAPYTPLKGLIREKVKGVLLIGEAAPKIRKDLAGTAKFYECKDMAGAVKAGAKLALPGEIVLLSPACASFDQYNDYEARGRHFKKLVREL